MLGLLLGGLWAWALWAWLGLHPVLHADALWLHDLLASGLGAVGRWDLPPASSLFPDYPLLWLARAFSDDLLGAQRAYGLLLGLWLWMALARLLRELLDYPKATARAYAAAGLLLGLLLSPAESGLADWLLPAHHGAAFVAALSVWAWALRPQRKPSGFIKTLLLGALAGLLLASDQLLGLWAGLPVLLLVWRLRSGSRWRVLLGLGLAVLSAWAARELLHATGARFAVPRVGLLLERGWPVWRNALDQLPALVQGAGVLAWTALAALLLWLWPQPQRHSGPRVLLLGWMLAVLSTLLLAALLSTLSGRYLYPALLLPALLLPALLAERWPSLDKAALLLPLLGALLWMGEARRLPAPDLEAPRQAAWLDEALRARGLQRGWADYWHARPLRLLSRQGTLAVPMVTVGPDSVGPYFWIGDRFLFTQGEVLTRPQFVVVDGLDPAAVRAKLGPPKETLKGEGLELWVYATSTRSRDERIRL